MYAIKVELKLNNTEKTLMRKHCGFSRLIYNYGLTLMLGLASNEVKGGITKKLAAIKKVLTNYTKKQPENSWMNFMSSRVYQNAFIALKSAYSRWRKGLGKAPRFKRKKDSMSFTVDSCNGKVILDRGKRIKIPKVGIFRLKEELPCSYATQTFTISEKAGRWYVSFSIDAEKLPPLFHPKDTVGIDIGIKTFATLSDGTTYDAPKPLKKAKIKLAKKQWRNRRKQLGNRRFGIKSSNKAKKYFADLRKIHAAIAHQRSDFLHKLTTLLTKKYKTIRIEDLNVSGMLANHKLAGAISDLGFYEFRKQLIDKASDYCCTIELLDRWYPSSKLCSNCGHKQDMPLKERVYKCGGCGCQIDRDLNAAINIIKAEYKYVRLA
ncbi:MAG: RNA-guided endonuclease TnpB family protein [Cyanobacteria bacterium J06635_10]